MAIDSVCMRIDWGDASVLKLICSDAAQLSQLAFKTHGIVHLK